MEKRVIYIGGFELPDRNAAAQRVLSNAKLLREMGYKVTFVGISKNLASAPSKVEGFESSPVPYPSNMRQWIHQIFTFINEDFIIQRKPEYVILYNFPSIASLRLLKICHKNHIQLIYDLTEWEANNGWTPTDIIRKIDIYLRMHYCTRRMDGVIAISRYLYDYYRFDVKTILVPPTVDLDNTKWNRFRVLKANNPITLVYAGSPGAGSKDRLDLIVDEVRNHINIKLVIVGVDEEQFLNAYHRRNEPLVNIEFKGRLPHIEAVKAVCDADFQMLIRDNNRKNDAGFPTKLVESMTCGTPIIASIFSNITDYVKDGENGFLLDGEKTLDVILDRVSHLSTEEIIAMKRNCINMRDFDYRLYISEFKNFFE